MPFQDNSPVGLICLIQDLSITREDGPRPFYVPVPLKKVNLDVKVVNFCCEVTVSQTYTNCESNPIECIYNFPVEEAAAVVDFTAELDGRTINTKVQEKSAARQEYREAMDNRQTAVIMEETKQDIFEVKVGHLSSGASCEIKIVYTMELPVELGMTKITIPTTVAPRYVPMTDGSPEALKIASIKHDFNSPVKMTLSLDVMMQKEIVSVTSTSHKIEITNKNKMAEYFVTTAKFDGDTTQMDRDLIVFVKSEDPHEPRVMVEKDEEDSHVAMLTFVPDFKLAEHKMEAIFLVDCSGSMSGSSMNLAKEALQVFIHSLPVSSYFNVILFGSSYKSLFPESRIYDDHTFQDAKTSIQGISANLGGTEILSPLSFILQQEVKAGLARQVFVLTDGQVSNSGACISLVRKHSATNRVFTLGVGSAADRHLVKGLARAGQGTAMFTSQGEQITPKIMEQLKNALQPCIADIEVKWGKSGQFEGSGELQVEVETKKTLFGFGKPKNKRKTKISIKNQVPSKVPPLYDGNRLIVYKKIDKNLEIDEEITIKAKTTEGILEHTFKVLNDSFIEGRNLHQLFARKLIQEVEERQETENNEEGKELIIELGMKYHLASKYTSFVGVDEKVNSFAAGMKTRNVANQTPKAKGQRPILRSAAPKSSTSNRNSSAALKLTMTQNANGSFPVSEEVAKIMNLDLAELLGQGAAIDPRAWMTLVCTVFLKTFCDNEKIIWELVVMKADKWLISSFPNVGENDTKKAVEFLKTKIVKD